MSTLKAAEAQVVTQKAQITELSGNVDTLTVKLKEKEREIQPLENTIDDLKNQVEAWRKKYTTADLTREKAMRELSDTKTKLRTSEADRIALDNTAYGFSRQLKKLQG